MIDTEKIFVKIKELDELIIELNDKRRDLIHNNSEEIDKRLQEEFEEFKRNNEERIYKEIIGNELTEIDNKIAESTNILNLLNGFVIDDTKPEEPQEDTFVENTNEEFCEQTDEIFN